MLYLFLKKLIHAGSQCCAMYQGNHTIVAISQGNRKGLPLPYAGLVSEIVAG